MTALTLSQSHLQHLYWTGTWLEVRQKRDEGGGERGARKERKKGHEDRSIPGNNKQTQTSEFVLQLDITLPVFFLLLLLIWFAFISFYISETVLPMLQLSSSCFHQCPAENAHHTLTFSCTVIQVNIIPIVYKTYTALDLELRTQCKPLCNAKRGLRQTDNSF